MKKCNDCKFNTSCVLNQRHHDLDEPCSIYDFEYPKRSHSTVTANLTKPHREVIEGLIFKYFQTGHHGLLETLEGYLQNIRKYYTEEGSQSK